MSEECHQPTRLRERGGGRDENITTSPPRRRSQHRSSDHSRKRNLLNVSPTHPPIPPFRRAASFRKPRTTPPPPPLRMRASLTARRGSEKGVSYHTYSRGSSSFRRIKTFEIADKKPHTLRRPQKQNKTYLTIEMPLSYHSSFFSSRKPHKACSSCHAPSPPCSLPTPLPFSLPLTDAAVFIAHGSQQARQ